jgi:thiamine-monophosphate kinase
MAGLPQAQAWCLGGGEDFELVLALEPAWAWALVAALPGSGVIGALVEGPRGELHWSEGDSVAVSGYRHFT